MQIWEHVELAAILAQHGPAIVLASPPPQASDLEPYWSSARCRLDRWSRCLAHYRDLPAPEGSLRALHSRRVRALLEEILAGEILTRVWAALLSAIDKRHGAVEADPLGRSIFLGHLESRHRALKLLLSSPILTAHDALQLNRLRRRVERWTDVLLAGLVPLSDSIPLAFDCARLDELVADLACDRRHSHQETAWQLLLAGLRSALAELLASSSPNADLNAKIAVGVLGAIPVQAFESSGTLRGLWTMRLMTAPDDAEGLLVDYFKPRQTESAWQTDRAYRNRRPRRLWEGE